MAWRWGESQSFHENGDRYIPLHNLADRYGFQMATPQKYLSLLGHRSQIRFELNSRRILFNGLSVWLNRPVTKFRGQWNLSTADIESLIEPLVQPQRHLDQLDCRVIVLDPGHGGRDSGAMGARGVEEKRGVLDIAHRARLHLANAGLKVYLTREGDRFIPLQERSRLAARWDADLFVSIHLNSANNRSASGIETHILAVPGYPSTSSSANETPARVTYQGSSLNGANVILGHALQKHLLGATGSVDRGLRRARFVVLKEATCPAALVECGFLSNAAEESRVLREDYRESLARGISDGILEYVNNVRRAQVASIP